VTRHVFGDDVRIRSRHPAPTLLLSSRRPAGRPVRISRRRSHSAHSARRARTHRTAWTSTSRGRLYFQRLVATPGVRSRRRRWATGKPRTPGARANHHRFRGLDDVFGLALALQLGLVLLPPVGQAVEQPQRDLRRLVERHLVLVLATLLREGAHAFVDPLVAVDLGSLVRGL
jgi:hypothetical protein